MMGRGESCCLKNKDEVSEKQCNEKHPRKRCSLMCHRRSPYENHNLPVRRLVARAETPCWGRGTSQSPRQWIAMATQKHKARHRVPAPVHRAMLVTQIS